MNQKPRKFYYGWIIVGLGLVSMAFWFGVRSSFSVFYVALLEEFRWTRAEAAGVQSVAMLTYTFVAPVVGGLIDRLGPRRVIAAGIFFGTGWGSTARLFMATAADLFKGRIFGLIYGIVEGAMNFGGAIGAWAAGFIFDKTLS